MPAKKELSMDTRIRWRRILVESVAIILSILLAFAIDAGWDTFKQRNQEKAFLISLLSDFKETRVRIDENTKDHEKFIAFGVQLLDFRGGNTVNIEPEDLDKMLGGVFFDFVSLYLPSGSRDALFASGDIDIISNKKLRAMLASWPSMVADAAEDEAFILNDVMHNSMPYLRGKVSTRNIARLSNAIATNRMPSIEPVNYEVLWNDPLFDNLVSSRILNETYTIRENVFLRETTDEIIRVIEEELNR
jgi:hypothetical protein